MLDKAESVHDDRRWRVATPGRDRERGVDVHGRLVETPEAPVGVGDERVDASLELLVSELEGDPQRLFGRSDGTRGLPGCPSAVRFDEQSLHLRPAGGHG